MHRLRLGLLVPLGALLALAPPAAARPGFNVDFGDLAGQPPSSWSAASGQPGTWNKALLGATALTDTSGASSGAVIDLTAASASGTFPDSATNAAECLLFDNFYQSGGNTWTVAFSGLPDGSYLVFLYASSNSLVPSGDMNVGGKAIDSIPGSPNALLLSGTSFAKAIVNVSGGALVISGTGTTFSGLAGLQLVPREASINIDFGVYNGPPGDGYGASALQPGHWNEVGLGLTSVLSVAGASTGVSIYLAANEDAGNAGSTPTTDDQRLLFDNFYRSNGGTWTVDINDLAPGTYVIYLYAPSNQNVSSGNLLVGGTPVTSFPGDASGNLVEGTSYVVVMVEASGEVLPITGTGPNFSGLAGIQIVPLPEPSGDAPLVLGAALLVALTSAGRSGARRARGA